MKTYNLHACDSNEALTLSGDILTAGRARRHPKLSRALRDVKNARDVLASVCAARDAADAADTSGVTPRMRVVRSVFAALAGTVELRAGIAIEHPLVAEARRTLDAVFPSGKAFLGGTAGDLEIECGRVLDRARTLPNAVALERMGAGKVLDLAEHALAELSAARQAVALAVHEDAVDGHTALQQVIDALRAYAENVQAIDIVEGTEREDELLAPLANRKIARRAPAAPPPAPADTPEIEAAPPSRAA
jgi:hypothetical protein